MQNIKKALSSTPSRRRFLAGVATAIGGLAATSVPGVSQTLAAASQSSQRGREGSKKARSFKAIDWSVNAWFPNGIGARFAGIGHPELGVCDQSSPWPGLPYSKNRREEVTAGWSPEWMIDRFDMAGVEKGGLLACWAAEGLGGKDCRVEAEEVYAVVNRFPDRFFGIVGVSPLPGRWSKHYPRTYIKHAVQQLGFKAVHMYPHWFGIKINDTRMYPIYETCSELGVPVLYQIGTGTGMSNSRIVALPEWVDDVARDFPDLTIIGIHAGGSHEQNFISMMKKDPNVYWGLDANSPATWPARGIDKLLQEDRGPGFRSQHQNPQDKILWATDFPVQDWVVSLQEFDALGLPDEIARKVLRDNAIRLFKL